MTLLASFAFYAPKLYQYYVNTLQKLYDHSPDLDPPFYGSIFPSQSPNSGANAVAYMHNDHNNLAFG